MQKITTIFWDLDGTLVNTEKLYDQSIEFACKQANCHMLHRIKDLPNGLTLQEDFCSITGLTPRSKTDSKLLNILVNISISYVKTNFKDDLVIKPTVELFNHFNKLGLHQSIVSNSNQELCDFIADKINIKEKCTHCFGAENVRHGKPNPQLYLHALKIHKVNSYQCLAFEDSTIGIKAAKAANLVVAGVGEASDKGKPDYCWDIQNENYTNFLKKLTNSFKFTY